MKGPTRTLASMFFQNFTLPYLTPSPNRDTFLKFNNGLFAGVGRTVPSFRIAAEIERTKWRQFRSLLDKKDRKMFDQMYDCVKLHNNSCSNTCRPVVIHSVLMSIIFEHYKQLTKLKEQQDTKQRLTSNTLDLWT
jgi:hypothetical protein